MEREHEGREIEIVFEHRTPREVAMLTLEYFEQAYARQNGKRRDSGGEVEGEGGNDGQQTN